MPAPDASYRGRFAPSPTGPLHLGSLIAALASYLEARRAGGTWLVRMEDLDPPREQPGAADAILHSLEAHGLHWDETVLWQSQRSEVYLSALEQLQRSGDLFACHCSRASTDSAGNCCGECRQHTPPPPVALRVPVASQFVAHWQDRWQGDQRWPIGQQLRDFVVRRKDQLFAYQLAVVVDDAAQGITHIVRGSDLLDSTPRQLWLQSLLNAPQPDYGHLPVLTNREGQKLSKQTHAPPLQDGKAEANLRAALGYLGQPSPPPDCSGVRNLLDFALARWDPQAVPPGPTLAPR
ncbi:tRNA glutamyl-Q(34) synthetase GluQRS [Parahaliea aestuarii]|uniref:Glutamyl-Q tRNA(Asp) synthetase n=1 Tax=Parahaliea aestuarii TaxID=1852021 RepID=A0A5C9A1R9_9GAMM|nr:tRNA glutamyl-Q(34) synthetase GluQRS [Parahaliea aestuarii]TXS94835.1 tRNA glutamyl-Q(34) synthetase GluQRS [Parahaliea aestuarii]